MFYSDLLLLDFDRGITSLPHWDFVPSTLLHFFEAPHIVGRKRWLLSAGFYQQFR